MLLALAFARAVRDSPIPSINRSSHPTMVLSRATACENLGECRTLWDIIRSCLFTVFLCTWVSLHPNIPGPDEKWWRVFLRRVGAMALAFVAPELVVAWAMRQQSWA